MIFVQEKNKRFTQRLLLLLVFLMSCSDPLEESDPRRPGVFLNVAIFKNSFKFMLLFTLLNTDDF